MKRPRTVTIRGKRWDVVYRRVDGADGWCESPDTDGKRIYLDPKVLREDDEAALQLLLHELGHAAYWDTAEAAIHNGAADIARALWRFGFRFCG